MPISFNLDPEFAINLRPQQVEVHNVSIGYITDFHPLSGAALAKSLTVPFPYNHPAPAYPPVVPVNGKVSVIGILGSFSWGGKNTDPLSFGCLMSPQTAAELRAVMESPQKPQIIEFGWWIATLTENPQTGVHEWVEVLYPKAPEKPSGNIVRFNIENTPVSAAQGLNLHKVSFEISPHPTQMVEIASAPSSTAKVVLNWGIKPS